MKKIFFILILVLFQGCLLVPRQEIVVDKKVIPNQCPTFDYKMSFSLKQPKSNIADDGWVFVNKNEFLSELLKFKEAKKVYNEEVEKLNQIKIIKGKPKTDNYKVIERIVYVKHKCPKFNFKFNITIRKKIERAELKKYYLIKYRELLYNLKKFQHIKEIFNK